MFDPFSMLNIAGGMLISRGVSGLISKIGEAIIPYGKSRDAKRTEHAAPKNMELEQMRQNAQRELLKRQLEANERLQENQIQANERLQMTARETSMLVAAFSSRNHIKEDFYRDAIRRFPLNISPLSLLENNDVSIDIITQGIANNNWESVRDYLKHDVKPLNVFVMPVTVDSRVGGNKIIAAQVWDSVYQYIESVFVNEYNVVGNHPVSLYSTAWNQNAKPGLHAAEELYFFLKYLPTIVVEPRFDGKKLRIMFTCWSIGYNLGQRIRQEIAIDFDWLPIIVTNAYERSKNSLKLFKGIDVGNNSMLAKKKEICELNVKTYESLHIGERIRSKKTDELDSLGDYSILFALAPYDWGVISDKVSHVLGVVMSALSDVHHLLSTDVEPVLPKIYNHYFPDIIDKGMAQTLLNLYEKAYYRLSMLEPNKRELMRLRVWNLYDDFPRLSKPKMMYDNPLSILIDKCRKEWGYRAKNEDDAFRYYAKHFTKEDTDFNNELLPHLSEEQKRDIQRRYFELNDNTL